jgi:hypothetical protein
MENDSIINTDISVNKEYQIPVLIDLNSIDVAYGQTSCTSGSSAWLVCSPGSAF